MDQLEVKINGIWMRVSVEDWWKLKNEPKRCISCHGPVYITRDFNGKLKPSLTHRRGKALCCGDNNVRSPRHPNALDCDETTSRFVR